MRTLKYATPFIFIIIISFIIIYAFNRSNSAKNIKCYSILKTEKVSTAGVETFSGVIIFSFLEKTGSITSKAELTTTQNNKSLLTQQINFKYDSSGNEYSIHVIGLTDEKIMEHLPLETSDYMKNILNSYFANPKDIKLWIYPGFKGDYVVHTEVIPWLYCNKIQE